MSADRLRAVEKSVADHPDVTEAAAVETDDAVAVGVVAAAFASPLAIRDHAWAALGDDAPRTVTLLAALPRDAAGEIDRARLRREVREGGLATSSYAAPGPGLETEVAAVLRQVLGAPRVGLDDEFLDLGGDSVTAVAAANLLEERTGLRIDYADLFDVATVRGVLGRAGR